MKTSAHIAGILAALVMTSGPDFAQGAAATPSNAPPAKTQRKVPDTLMFTIDEFNDIQGHLSRGGEDGNGGSSVTPENVSLYLSTILYYGPKDWTIWVNGVPIGPGESFQAFKVNDITASYVEFLVPLSAQGMRPVRLGPNQTFIASSGIVVEGQRP